MVAQPGVERIARPWSAAREAFPALRRTLKASRSTREGLSYAPQAGRKLGQDQAAQPSCDRGAVARAAPVLLLRHGPRQPGDRPAVRGRRVLLERGDALQD